MVNHRFARSANAGPGRLCVIRVPGTLTNTAIDEYAAFSPQGRARVAGETLRWF
jgi:hypothetical protein